MRYFKLHFIFTLIMLLTCGSMHARVEGPVQASDGSTVYMPTSDGVCKVYQVEGTVTFKAVESGEMSNYKDFGVAFLPANEGDHIMITVNSIDIDGGTHLIMYDGDVDYSKIGTSGAGGSSPFTYFPAGWVKEIVKGTDEGYTFTSTQDNGIVAFGCTTRSGTRNGWNITVTSLASKDMEYVSSEAITGLPSVNRGAKSQNIFGVDIVTDGGANALTLNALSIDCSALTGSTAVSNVRLVNGSTVLATAATVGDALSASGITLKSGHNKLMVVADINPDASGTIPALSVSSITVDGEARTPSPATGSAITINNVIVMAAEGVTYTIDDNGANFYDDGGKDANYSQNFSGQVTFVPATAGQSIKVDFTNLDLFDATIDSNDDVFKFYNGREVNEANLITTLLTESEIVKSTADDGSMTVTFKTVTGYPKSGWEATVSQFLPGDMTLSGVTAEVASTATVSAGDTDAQMLVVDVMTDNQSNPLAVSTINLTTPDTKNIAKARAYYLGKKNVFATTNQWAETAVTGTSIALSGNQTLAEGHNYFAIVLDLNEEGVGGEQVSLSVQDVVVGETTQAPTEAVTATRTIDNICHATQGSHSHTIKDAWKFTHTEGYSGKYEAEDADYIVTFTPSEAGTVAEIDFSSFNVIYSSSTYTGVRAVYEIYSGTEIDNTNLLWQLKDNSEQNVGPGKVLRSTSADGSLTIRFNPKTTTSTYAGTGWMATVRPFRNHEMTIDEITVNQTSSDDVAVGAADAALIDFKVVTEGTLTTTTLNAVKLDMKDSHSNVSKVSVYCNNENNRETAVLFGAVENPAQSAITVAGERDLAEGSNYFWVTADIKADAAAEAAIDAKLVALVDANNVETAVENGDPEGVRTVKYLYVMPSGTSIVTVTDPMLFYDDGGKDGKITSRFSGTVTFVPGRENSAVQMNANSFSIGNGRMTVYSGSQVDETQVIGPSTGYYSTTTGPANLISKAEDGSLTVVVSGPTGTTLDGWEIEVSLHEKTPFVIETANADATTTDIMRNTVDGQMQHLTLEVSGDKNPIAISSITFDATGTTDVADITAAKVYYTGTTATFDNSNLAGSLSTVAAGENTITFDEPILISDNGNFNLWLTYDIAEEATAGNTVAAQLVSLASGDATTAVTGTAAQRAIKAGMKGNYIIGSSDLANYASFAQATAALAGGVEGPVTFQVEDGTYNEAVNIANVAGASEKAPIAFVSLSGNRDNVVVKGVSSAYDGNMVTIENTPWVSFEAMSFVPASQSYKNAIYVHNRSSHFTLKDCYVKAEIITSGYSGINLLKSETVSGEDNSNNDYMTIEGNTFEGGYISVYLNGASTFYFRDDRSPIICNNVITNPRSKAIYTLDCEGTLIEGNIINQSATTANSYSAIDVYRNTGAFVIKDNVIVNSHSAYSNGIYLRMECEGESANKPALVYNNSIVISNSPTNSTAGIQVNNDTRNVALYYNTVRVAGSAGYCFYNANNSTRYSNVKLQNNLFQNLTNDGYVALFYDETKLAATEMLNNVFYAASGNLVKDYATTIDALNTAVGNESNKVEQAEFLGDIDNHLMSAGNLNIGLPVDFITTDVEGNSRDAEAPTVGAYEYKEVVVETPELAEGYPVVTNVTESTAAVKSKWSVSGKLYTMVEAVPENQGGNGAPAKAPTADDLQANGTAVDYVADTEATTTFSDLEPNTQYKAYMMVVSALDVPSEVAEAEFTTARHIDPLTATLAKKYGAIEAGESVTLIPVVRGGDEPYTYEWRNQMNEVIGDEATIDVEPDHSQAYRLTVTSADGQTAKAKTAVIVLGDHFVATIDDNYIDETGFFNGDNDDDEYYSGSYALQVGNAIWPGSTVSFWYGWAMSNQQDNTFGSLDDQYHSANGGANSGQNFVIGYPQGQYITVTHDEEGDVIPGMYINNTAYTYSSVTQGDGYADPFTAGKWLKMTVSGYNASGATTGTVEYYLADYRSTNAIDRYALNSWQWLDLSTLGTVKSIAVTIDGNDRDNWGLKTPAYVALDDIGATCPFIEQNTTVPVGSTVEVALENYFDIDNDGSTAVYTLTNPVESDDIDVALNDENGSLEITGKVNNAEYVAIATVTQKGKTQYLRLTITVDTNTGADALVADRDIESVTYVNAMGQVSNKPWSGVNIVVTRYADGTTQSKRLLMK
ncbi:MAG: DUF4465 domain-containing protein [Muribaculaceae bacterium]|nr:DUF4465 domain-containing protein [Muribaculaceae bacterium]